MLIRNERDIENTQDQIIKDFIQSDSYQELVDVILNNDGNIPEYIVEYLIRLTIRLWLFEINGVEFKSDDLQQIMVELIETAFKENSLAYALFVI